MLILGKSVCKKHHAGNPWPGAKGARAGRWQVAWAPWGDKGVNKQEVRKIIVYLALGPRPGNFYLFRNTVTQAS